MTINSCYFTIIALNFVVLIKHYFCMHYNSGYSKSWILTKNGAIAQIKSLFKVDLNIIPVNEYQAVMMLCFFIKSFLVGNPFPLMLNLMFVSLLSVVTLCLIVVNCLLIYASTLDSKTEDSKEEPF